MWKPVLAATAALTAIAPPASAAAPTHCVVRGSRKVLIGDTCHGLGAAGTQAVDIAGMPGEAEHAQIVLDAGLAAALAGAAAGERPAPFSLTTSPLTPRTPGGGGGSDGVPRRGASIDATLGASGRAELSSTATAAPIPASAFRLSVVGHVNCSKTTRYSPSGGGWHPDPLFPLASGAVALLPRDLTSSVFVRVDLPRAAQPGVYEGRWSARLAGDAFNVPVTVTVWSTPLPEPADVYKSFGEIWSFTTNTFTGPNTTNATTVAYMDMMTDHLLPPDSLYKPKPYDDFGVYAYLNATGKQLLNLADISNLDGTYDTDCKKPYTPEYINSTLEMLAPTVDRLKASGILDTKEAYVYGYDEQPASCEANIRALFGAVKARWPFLTTAAVLNWKGGLPVDLPVDVWILQYEDYVAADAKRWKAAGKRQFWYHCIEPSGGAFLNTFIERPWVQGRLLYWLGVREDIDGWLYYAVDLWVPHPGKQIRPIALRPGSTLTDYDPSNYIWSPRTDIFANGDGQFLYPGADGPVATARLANMRDAVEDQALLEAVRRAGKTAELEAAIAKLVRSPTDHTDDGDLLEATRRSLAALLEQ